MQHLIQQQIGYCTSEWIYYNCLEENKIPTLLIFSNWQKPSVGEEENKDFKKYSVHEPLHHCLRMISLITSFSIMTFHANFHTNATLSVSFVISFSPFLIPNSTLPSDTDKLFVPKGNSFF